MDQIFALQQVFEKSWEMPKRCTYALQTLKKQYDRVSRDKLRAVLLEYDVKGQLLAAIKLSQTLFGNPKGPVELGNPNTSAETKLCLILVYSDSRSSLAMSLKPLYS